MSDASPPTPIPPPVKVPLDSDRVLYFGCWTSNDGRSEGGHYLVNRFNQGVHERQHSWIAPFQRRIDGVYCPYARKDHEYADGPQIEGAACLHHVHGWTVLAFWDRSVDKRGGSNSALLAPGEHSFDDMVELFQRFYPQIWARFKFKVYPHTSLTQTKSDLEIERLRALVVSLGGTP